MARGTRRLRLLALHPAVADVPPNAALPGALQLAVLDLLAAPLAELAQTFCMCRWLSATSG
ncbi:MAG: hypothetical protein ACLT2T_08030 [Bilophila wadsworthia]